MTLHFKNGLEIDYFIDKKDIFGLKDAINSKADIDNFLEDNENM